MAVEAQNAKNVGATALDVAVEASFAGLVGDSVAGEEEGSGDGEDLHFDGGW